MDKPTLPKKCRSRTSPELSERQAAILAFIRSHIQAQGWAPTYRMIGRACDRSSTSVVSYNLQALVRLGCIELGGGAGQIRIVDRSGA